MSKSIGYKILEDVGSHCEVDIRKLLDRRTYFHLQSAIQHAVEDEQRKLEAIKSVLEMAGKPGVYNQNTHGTRKIPK